MNVWEIAILKSMNSLGGEAGLQQIYEILPSFIQLTEEDLRETKWGGRPSYQHQVRSHITNLCQASELSRVSRGSYSLTEKGRKRIGVMAKKYKNPPIIEALCEFQFVPTHPWDLTIPGLMYEKVKNEFPDKQQKIGVGVQFVPTEKGLEHKMGHSPPRIQFHRKDKTALIQVAPDLLAVNQLKPYPTWSKFKPMILQNLHMYKEVANPKGFKRIELRYINKINIRAESVELSEYFDFYPYIPKKLPQSHTNFISRVEIPYLNNRDRMLITIGSALSERPDTLSIVLDIDYIMSISEAMQIDAVEEWLEQAHSAIESSFEHCIKDKSRILFEEVK